MKLYDYFRSSASYRVRIALRLKNLEAEYAQIHLLNNGGEQHSLSYGKINAQNLVPTLEDNERCLTQSLAIIEYLDEQYPTPPLLSEDPYQRGQIRSLAQMISCDIHPLNNLRVLQYLKQHFSADDAAVRRWYQHWIREGFNAFEKQLESTQQCSEFCVGNAVSLADLCLIPQVYNAVRFEVDLGAYSRIDKINQHCLTMPAFIMAGPEKDKR